MMLMKAENYESQYISKLTYKAAFVQDFNIDSAATVLGLLFLQQDQK